MTETAQPEQQLENPLLEGLRLQRTPEPCALVIFGASGDLTRRKLFPALYSLALRRLLPEKFGVVGVFRSEESDYEFRDRMKHAVQEFGRDEFREDVWEWLAEGMRYVSTDFADEGGEDRVVTALTELDEKRGTAGNRVYYLAVPPDAISMLARGETARAADLVVTARATGAEAPSASAIPFLRGLFEKAFGLAAARAARTGG